MSEHSGGRERSEQSGASERVSGASERGNGRASGPVLQSVFLAVIDHSALLISVSSLIYLLRFCDVFFDVFCFVFPSFFLREGALCMQDKHREAGGERRHGTMGQNREKCRINSHPIIHCPTSEGVSKVSDVSKQASERA